MKEQFEEKRFGPEAEARIRQANAILREYEAGGYDLSLRQLYYQFVARDLIPNTERSYKNLGTLISEARLCGLIDWNMIRDRGRIREENSHWNSPADILHSAAEWFRIFKWEDQPYHVEVMVEKQALEGVLLPVCSELDIAFTANKGYSSSSALYESGKRLARIRKGKRGVIVLYLGDHDPSGIDMTRDVKERLELFSRGPVDVRRLALNMQQIEELQPPENPAKLTDSRASQYVKRFGYSSWELDAIEPRALAKIVRDAMEAVRDDEEWNDAEMREENMREALRTIARNYQDGEAR